MVSAKLRHIANLVATHIEDVDWKALEGQVFISVYDWQDNLLVKIEDISDLKQMWEDVIKEYPDPNYYVAMVDSGSKQVVMDTGGLGGKIRIHGSMYH